MISQYIFDTIPQPVTQIDGYLFIAAATAFFAIAAWFIPRIATLISELFALMRTIIKEFYDLRDWMKDYQKALTDQQTSDIKHIVEEQTGGDNANGNVDKS